MGWSFWEGRWCPAVPGCTGMAPAARVSDHTPDPSPVQSSLCWLVPVTAKPKQPHGDERTQEEPGSLNLRLAFWSLSRTVSCL